MRQHLIHQNLKKAKALIGNQRGVYSSVLPQQHTAFLHNIKLYGYRTGIKFDNNVLIAEQNNYGTKNANAQIVYDLAIWLKNPLHNFELKKFLFGVINTAKNNCKGKWMYSVLRIAFDGEGSWNFGDDDAKNVVIFVVDNSSTFYCDNLKNKILQLGEEPTYENNGYFNEPNNRFSIDFSKKKINIFELTLNHDNIYLFVNGKEFYKFNADNEIANIQTQFCLGSISDGFCAADSREVSLKEEKSGIYIHKYLMVQNNIKVCSALLNKCLLDY